MTLEQWDVWVGRIADSDDIVLGDDPFKEEDGETLARILATVGWPNYDEDRMYAKAGDYSNHALRRLQRKYEVALKIIAASEGRG